MKFISSFTLALLVSALSFPLAAKKDDCPEGATLDRATHVCSIELPAVHCPHAGMFFKNHKVDANGNEILRAHCVSCANGYFWDTNITPKSCQPCAAGNTSPQCQSKR